ncbi:MAG: flagellar biosynthetic protein FliO [Phycisphaerae bacterium]
MSPYRISRPVALILAVLVALLTVAPVDADDSGDAVRGNSQPTTQPVAAETVGAEEPTTSPATTGTAKHADGSESGARRPKLGKSLRESLYGGKNGDDSTASGPTTPTAIWKMIIYTIILGAVVVAGYVVYRKYMPRLMAPAGKRPMRGLQVEQTLSLGVRKTVHVLRVGDRRILLGSTRDCMTNLGDVTDAFAEETDTPEVEL